MKQLSSLKFWYSLVLMLATVSFTACVDDNDDTEAPFLEVAPTTLTFTEAGIPAEGSQSFFEIKTNRSWTATVQDGADWVTLSKIAGEGSTKVEVSVPGGAPAEAKIDVVVSNKTGQLFKETVKVIRVGASGPVEVKTIYNETFGTATKDGKYWPYVDQFQGWVKTGEGAETVTYSGKGSSVRQSGKLSEVYENASGEAKLFFGSNADFVVNKITLAEGQVNLKLTFGASYSKNNNGSYDNEFKPEKFHFYLSADGQKWTDAIAYETVKAGDFWVFATSNFTLKNAVSELYIKFVADEASVFAIDDVTLTTGVGGAEVDLNAGGTTPQPQPSEAKEISFADIQAKMAAPGVIDADFDRYFVAVVQNDMTTGTRSRNNLQLAAVNASKAGEGITLYGDIAENAVKDLNLALGDKVKVTLTKGLAKTNVYGGLRQITGAKGEAWAKIEKMNENVKITPVEITADKLADYQAMTVVIKNAAPKAAGTWCTAADMGLNDFVAGGVNFTVFCAKASAFADKAYQVATADIVGVALVHRDKAQLVPRNLEDVKAFTVAGGDQGGQQGGDQGGQQGGQQQGTPTVSINFADDAAYPAGFPADKTTAGKDEAAYAFGAYTLKFFGTASGGFYKGAYKTDKYLMIGKKGAYIETPALEGKKLVKVIATTRKGASTNVAVAVANVDNTAVKGGEKVQWNNTAAFDYTYTLTGTAVNTAYRIVIDSGREGKEYNAQFTKLELFYE